MRRMSEWRQLLTGTSMMRYLPPMGTAGLDRFRVRGKSRVPRPPPRITPITSCMAINTARSVPGAVQTEDPNSERGARASERNQGEAEAALRRVEAAHRVEV